MDFSFGNNETIYNEAPQTFYQIAFNAANCGKIVPMSKRNIRFKFGYTNMPAVYDGFVGQDCRGAEHEVSVSWSLSSGKQTIMYDDEVVYFNVCDMSNGKMTYSWHDKTGHYLKVIVHSLSTSLKQTQDAHWKQYDLLIDGVSYFRAPQIYQLGVFKKNTGGYEMNAHVKQESAIQSPVTKSSETIDLLSFDTIPIPVTPTSTQQSGITTRTTTSSQTNSAIMIPKIGESPTQQYVNYIF